MNYIERRHSINTARSNTIRQISKVEEHSKNSLFKQITITSWSVMFICHSSGNLLPKCKVPVSILFNDAL